MLRYGPPLHTTFIGPGRYDWDFADETFGEIRRRDIIAIVDLCHFGLPDWIGNFQNPDFPELFAAYAEDFARRFPWVQLYTPINEMFVCATFSAAYGWWNEQMSTDRSFVTALKHIVRANVLAMERILKVRPDAIFVQSESTEYFHAENPAAIKPAEIMNSSRFLSLDLNYGRRVDSEMYEFLMDNGMTRDEYHFFLEPLVAAAPLHHGQRLLRHQRAPGEGGRHDQRGRATSSATTTSPASTTTAIGCRSCTRKPTLCRGRTGTRR